MIENFFFYYLHFQWWFTFLGKVIRCFKNVTSIKKLPIGKVESFSKSNFWPKWNIQKYCLYKTIQFGTLTQLACFIFFLKFIEMLWSSKRCIKAWVGRRQGRDKAKNVLSQAILNKMFGTKWNNPVKPDRRRKVLYVFACFSAAIGKVYVLERRLDTWLCVQLNLRFS